MIGAGFADRPAVQNSSATAEPIGLSLLLLPDPPAREAWAAAEQGDQPTCAQPVPQTLWPTPIEDPGARGTQA